MGLQVDAVIASSLERFVSALGEPPPVEAKDIVVVERRGLWACAGTPADGIAYIEVGSGTLELIDQLTDQLRSSPLWRSDLFPQVAAIPDRDGSFARLAELAFEWLLLHELVHLRLDHPQVLGVTALVEIDPDATRSATSNRQRPILLDEIGADRLPHVSPCLELQADSDAFDMLFRQSGKADWSTLRLGAAAAVLMMVLIEQANLSSAAPRRTHPDPSTRFFQLMAQLTQLWLMDDATLERRDGETRLRSSAVANEDRFLRYKQEVLAPVAVDALVIAGAGGLASLVDVLADPERLFADVMRAQHDTTLDPGAFATRGGREWATLLPINEAILTITRQRRWIE